MSQRKSFNWWQIVIKITRRQQKKIFFILLYLMKKLFSKMEKLFPFELDGDSNENKAMKESD